MGPARILILPQNASAVSSVMVEICVRKNAIVEVMEDATTCPTLRRSASATGHTPEMTVLLAAVRMEVFALTSRNRILALDASAKAFLPPKRDAYTAKKVTTGFMESILL